HDPPRRHPRSAIPRRPSLHPAHPPTATAARMTGLGKAEPRAWEPGPGPGRNPSTGSHRMTGGYQGPEPLGRAAIRCCPLSRGPGLSRGVAPDFAKGGEALGDRMAVHDGDTPAAGADAHGLW